MLSYILWDYSPGLFTFGKFTLQWDGLLLIVAFIIGRQILGYIYKQEDKPTKDLDILATYLIVAAFIGARLGHAIFFQPQLWSKPLSIFIPFEFKPFHFIGISGFSSHGAIIGIFLAIWIYSLRKKPGQSFLQVLDRTSILAVWIAVFLLIGSFLNSEIEGKPTASGIGTVMIKPVMSGISKLPCCVMRTPGGKNPLNLVLAKKGTEEVQSETGYHPIALYLFFNSGIQQNVVDEFMVGDVKTYLYDMAHFIYEPGTEPLHYDIFKESGDFSVRVRTIGVARYPVQLFEAASCLLVFVFVFSYWNRFKLNLAAGRIFGFGMTTIWSLRFMYEFLKEDQEPFIKGMGLNTAQALSIPLIIVGIIVLLFSYRKTIELK